MSPHPLRALDRWQLAALLMLALIAISFALLQRVPVLDPALHQPIFHYYIVTFTSFTAAVVAWLVVASVGEAAAPSHLLFGLAFAAMSSLFFVHGLTTPDALTVAYNPGVVWSAWLTLLAGGVFFAGGAYLASGLPSGGWRRQWRRIIGLYAGAYLTYVSVVFLAPGWLAALDQLAQPWHAKLIFSITFTLWLAAGLRLWSLYRRENQRLDGLMALMAALMCCATISMHFFPLWHLSWWSYHALLLVGFLITIVGLWRTYEQRRTFRLTSYFAAASLIIIAALALGLSEVFARLSNDDFIRQFEAENTTHATTLAQGLAMDVPAFRSPQAVTASEIAQDGRLSLVLGQQLASMHVMEFSVYDLHGRKVYTANPNSAKQDMPSNPGQSTYGTAPSLMMEAMPSNSDETLDPEELSQVALGETISEWVQPGEHGVTESMTVLDTYVPVPPVNPAAGKGAPTAILELVRPVPELQAQIVAVRTRTAVAASLAMGLLFLLLLGIVRHADALIQIRTAELERANADLRRSEALRDDLTHMVVHDLRSPLSAIFANLNLLQKSLDRPDLAEKRPRFLGNVHRSSHAMADLIDTLLDISRMEAGELHLNRQPITVTGLLQAGADRVTGQAEQEGKQITVEIAPNLPEVVLDRDLIGRVIHNLVQNALKHTQRGGHITLLGQALDGHIVVRVRDDGEGIPPEDHARIFDKFAQVNGATRNGTGLGLAFCRLAVHAHGGGISVESQPGQGSTFSFTLPIQ